MNIEELYAEISLMNESEVFYQKYFNAQKSKLNLLNFLDSLDIDYLRSMNLIIPEIEETIPPIFLEEWFFDKESKQSIHIQKHNCYSPNILHKHNFFELFYVLEGTCTQNIGEIYFEMKAGDICLIPPETMHSISVFDNSIVIDILIRKSTFTDIFLNILRSENILSRFFMHNLYAPQKNDYIIFRTENDIGIEHLVMNLFLEYRNQDLYYNDILNSGLVTLFSRVLRDYEDNYETATDENSNRDDAYELVRFIKDNYKDVTLSSVANNFHFTTEYTSRLIKKLTSSTFTSILRSTRLEIAIGMLTDTNISISDISHEIGYNNVEHFIRTFKAVYILTPSEYRKMFSN